MGLRRRVCCIGLLSSFAVAFGCSDGGSGETGEGSGPTVSVRDLTDEQAATLPVFGDDQRRPMLEIVFQSIRRLDANGAVVSAEQLGTLTLADWQRVASPAVHR